MPSTSKPRKGSMQFWPRKKAKKIYAKVRSWPKSAEPKFLAFIGYKVGMIHLDAINENKNSHLKGVQVSVPATLIECPPMKIFSVRFYNLSNSLLELKKEIFFKSEKALGRKIKVPKDNSNELEKINPEDFERITVSVYTLPQKTGVGRKKPELIELSIGGTNQEKIDFIKQNLNKEFFIDAIFEENQIVDVHAITKGRGFQGPVKRFGIGLKSHKSEKGRRAPGSLGPWVRQQHISWRVAHAGQTGFHQRVDYNKQILKICAETELAFKDIHKYGNMKSSYIIIHGSVPGPKKRPLVIVSSIRKTKKKHELLIQ